MKHLVLFTLLILFNKYALCQQVLKNQYLQREFFSTNEVFNDDLFNVNRYCPDDHKFNFFKLLKSDTINTQIYAPNSISIELLKIELQCNATMMNIQSSASEKLNEDTLVYYMVLNGAKVYKLFGFYTSDIRVFYNYIGDTRFAAFSKFLNQNKVLNRHEYKLFNMAVKKGKNEYPTGINRPCNLLKYYFGDKHKNMANTILLPPLPPR